MTTNTSRTQMNDMFDQMAELFTTGMRTGATVQNESFRYMTEGFTRGAEVMRGTMERFVGDVGPMTKKNMDRVTRLMDEQAQRSADIFRNCADMTRCGTPAEMTERFMTMWRDSMTSMRDMCDVMTRSNVEMCEQFGEALRDAAVPTNGKTTTKTRK